MLRYAGRKEGILMNNRTFRAVVAVFFITVITLCAISITRKLTTNRKIDITDEKLYTLSDGTKTILNKLSQPVTIKLYYARVAATKAPDAIRHYNEYYHFVRALLEEYVAAGKGMVKLEVIDPRPYSDAEEEALRYGLKRFPITEDEGFFFGLVAKTEFGAAKAMEFFAPDRQTFVEYDISYLLDTVIARERNKIGILSSLPVMGDEMSGYMAQMMQMQGQRPVPAWAFVQQLQQRYDVRKIEANTEEIKKEDIDLLMVIHPKDLPDKTLFAIEQFVLDGGRAIVCVDPHCFVDQPSEQMGGRPDLYSQSSDLNRLLKTWGVEVKSDSFVGDKALAESLMLRENQPPEPLIALLKFVEGCFNKDNVISSQLGQVRMLLGGVVQRAEVAQTDKDKEATGGTAGVTVTPLVYTTSGGNSWAVKNKYELMRPDPKRLLSYFKDGKEPVNVACMVTGKLKSSFPDGIDVTDEAGEESGQAKEKSEPKTRHLGGQTESKEDDCVVVVFADVDFISDGIAYEKTFFGSLSASGDNINLLVNTIENLLGSGDLIAIRSRGSFARPFVRVDEIEQEAKARTSEQEAVIVAQIKEFETELNKLANEARSKGESTIDAAEYGRAKGEIEGKIRTAKVSLRKLQDNKRQQIEALGSRLRNANMLAAPSVILLVAILIGVRRGLLRRRYISHASD